MATEPERTPREQSVAELHALNARFIENFIRNDVAGHDALLHAEFLAIQGNGVRLDRAAYLKGWATGFDPQVIPYWDVRDEVITLIGNVALVRATNKYVIRRDGRETPGMSTYTDTYLLAQGVWKCIQAQTTPIAKGCEPGDDTILSVYLGGVRQEASSR
jgi:hypothetical protein